jgi:PAS domain S-box-containing protein
MVGLAFDVTERKKAEVALKKSEERYRTFINAAHDAIFVADAETGVILEANSKAGELLGMPVEEIVGMHHSQLHPENELAENIAGFKRSVKSGRSVTAEREIHILTRDGQKVPVEISTSTIELEVGKPLAFGIFRDITVRKRTEEALRKSEEGYRGLFDSARDAIFIADVETGTIVNANAAAERLLGRPTSEIIGMHQSELHPEEKREAYGVAFKEAVMQGEAVSPDTGGEIYVVNKSGGKIPIEISANIIEFEGKKFLQGIFRDITERKAAEQAVREGKQFLENILNSIQDGICILDRERNIIMVNPTMEKWFANKGPLTGRKCYEVFYDRTEVCDPCPCAPTFETGQCVVDILHYEGIKGIKLKLEHHAFPLHDPETGEVTGVIKYFRDVTENLALQAEAFRAAQLASVGELAAGVAHEINNPINGIINYAQLLINRLPKGSEENNISGRIVKEGDRISGIVSALLTFTRDQDLVEELLHLEDLVTEMLLLTVAQLAKDGIDVRINIPADLPGVKGKRQHLEQVFLNLTNNARHALNAKYPEGHEEKGLEISGESMVAEEIPHVRISFTDRGVGIAADIRDKVTEPFFTTKHKESGTGLGLSISRSIIENHGGKLSIESAEGEYTKVIIDLPAGETE